MTINRNVFFPLVRTTVFGGRLTVSQVKGLNELLDMWEAHAGLHSDLRHFAYMLATAAKETARHMLPVIETRAPGETSNPSVDEAIRRLEKAWAAGKMPWVKTPYWRKDASGLSWLGRGYPQLTHKANYETADKKLRPMGALLPGQSLVVTPDLALNTKLAACIMYSGMTEGWFTGKKLEDYIHGATADYYNARRIINGLQDAHEVATLAEHFIAALDLGSRTQEIAPKSAAVAPSLPAAAAASAVVQDSRFSQSKPEHETPRVPSPNPIAAKGSTMDNVFGSFFSQMFGKTAVNSAVRKVAGYGLTAAATYLGVKDQSWVPGAATTVAAGGVFLWDWAQSRASAMVSRTASIEGVTVKTPDGKTHG